MTHAMKLEPPSQLLLSGIVRLIGQSLSASAALAPGFLRDSGAVALYRVGIKLQN
jgi:hypothetical protein